MKPFDFHNPVRLYFGPGSLARLGEAVAGLGSKALLVTGQSSRRNGTLARVERLLHEVGVEVVTFDRARPNPLSTTVGEGVAVARAEECDFVVGLGGGSPVDTAKAIALCAGCGGEITDYQPGGVCADSKPDGALPVVAIVTTAGTGTEINRYLVITNAATLAKPGIGFECTYPAVGIVDPELMLSVPPEVTVDTGLDVLYHALEAYLSRNAHPLSDLYALEAIRRVVANLERAAGAGEDLSARTGLAWASTLAGWAIDLAGTVAVHAAGHPISGRLGAAHARSLVALGPTYLRQNWEAAPERCAVLARLLAGETIEAARLTAVPGEPAVSGMGPTDAPDAGLAAQAADRLREFQRRVGRDITVSDLGVNRGMIPQLARDTFATMKGALENNPRPMTMADVERLYQESL